ncbi:right-handed parallel beta-helix repeat-containing protein [Cellulomonas sp. 179-A 9B4 NHS]|uniref:right-handed parallel beta-helix repeat-containing protein n=1 Tax=Cellulomonas sp. 179-A 9B4 NHS TaxID=3142379 RepID=UPI00399FC2FE
MNVSSSVVATALLVGSCVLAAPAAAAPPPAAPALACGDTVTGAVLLDRDLVCTTAPGLVLTRGATVDLGGHTVRGPGEGTGLLIDWPDGESGTDPVTVVNGTVRDWGTGIEVQEATLTLRGMTFDRAAYTAVSGFRSDVTLEDSTIRRTGYGVNVYYYGSLTVARSRFVDNGTGLAGGFNTGMTVTDSTFERNTTGAECSESYAQVIRTRVVRNTTGVSFDWCLGSRLHDSELVRNETAFRTRTPAPYDVGDWEGDQVFRNRFDRNEVAVDLRENAHLQDNRFTRNGTAFRALTAGNDFPISLFALERNTFDRNGDAVDVDTRIRMQDNVATRNTGWGIHTPAAEDLGGNVAWGNGREPQCTGVVCAGRPRS